jgi:hypothetical protein
MGLLASVVDESFSPVDSKGNTLPHVAEACKHMAPVVEKHAAFLAKAVPYFAFGYGCMLLVSPTYEPVTEIIAGVRKPRIFRKDPADIYTEEYKAAENARATKEQKDKGEKAANRVVEVPPQQRQTG